MHFKFLPKCLLSNIVSQENLNQFVGTAVDHLTLGFSVCFKDMAISHALICYSPGKPCLCRKDIQ